MRHYATLLLLLIGLVAMPVLGDARAAEIQVPLKDLKPTQAVISHDQVTYKLQRYANEPELFAEDLAELPRKTVVIGPGNTYYLTDGHHTFSAMIDYPAAGPEFDVTVTVTTDKSMLSETEFWQWMQTNHQTWLFDENGGSIQVSDLPAQVGRDYLADDTLRGALYFLRKHYLEKPDNAVPFLEFYWANFLRDNLHENLRKSTDFSVPEERNEVSDVRWLIALGEFIRNLPADTPIGPNGETAEAMGQVQFGVYEQPIVMPLPRHSDDDSLVMAVVEIPTGSTQKWQMNKARKGWLEWEFKNDAPRQIQYLGYPANYGAVPGTLAAKEDGGDGDPLDVLILGEPLPAGAQVSVRLIGRLQMLDNGERDDKFIAVVPTDDTFGELTNLDQLNELFPGITDIIATWFRHYKGADGEVTGLEFEAL